MEIDSFYKYLISKGYYFDKELIENYLLSLKVKPFVILTGNSGTGKTKLAQLFARYMDDFSFNDSQVDGEDYVTIKVKTNYSSWENNGWTLSKDEISDILPINECNAQFNMSVDNIPAEGNIKNMV